MVIPGDPCERCGEDPTHCGCEETYHEIPLEMKSDYCSIRADEDMVRLHIGGGTVSAELYLNCDEARRIGEALCRVAAYIEPGVPED
jgi:hypothetical protein